MVDHVVIMDNQLIPQMIADGLLAEIDPRNVPNFKYISPNFRNLTHDPDNRYTIPYTWGTTGLVVRTDLVAEPVTHWADLWGPRYAGRILLWDDSPRYMLGPALLTLGYSPNSENRAELEAALARLIELKPHATWKRGDTDSSAPWLISGEVVMAQGWAYDVTLAREGNPNVSYVLPEEGALLWGDNLAIPSTTRDKYTAELLLNWVLRPEITGQLVNLSYYPMPNDAATPFIEAEILNDPVIYPSNEQMENAVLLLPLSADGEALYEEIWDRFLAAGE